MLVALLIAAALAAGQNPAPTPDANHAPTPEEVDALQQLYDSSCGSRGYGEYDDICIQITQQLNDAKAAAEKAQEAKARRRPNTPSVPPPQTSPAQPASAPPPSPPQP
jgi:hypothetical protein